MRIKSQQHTPHTQSQKAERELPFLRHTHTEVCMFVRNTTFKLILPNQPRTNIRSARSDTLAVCLFLINPFHVHSSTRRHLPPTAAGYTHPHRSPGHNRRIYIYICLKMAKQWYAFNFRSADIRFIFRVFIIHATLRERERTGASRTVTPSLFRSGPSLSTREMARVSLHN